MLFTHYYINADALYIFCQKRPLNMSLNYYIFITIAFKTVCNILVYRTNDNFLFYSENKNIIYLTI